jgi:hypothetical protein
MLNTKNLEAGAVEPASKTGLRNWITEHYTRRDLWSLFLMCVFPLHAWALVLAFRDVDWVTERTNAWDAVGVVSYGLLFTLVETLAVFVIMVLLGYIAPARWKSDRRVALLSLLVLLVSLWAMLEQLFFLIPGRLPGWLISFFVANAHPLRLVYIVFGAVVAITVLVPVLLFVRSPRGVAFIRGLAERLSILSLFYLVLDAIGVVIVIVRNL